MFPILGNLPPLPSTADVINGESPKYLCGKLTAAAPTSLASGLWDEREGERARELGQMCVTSPANYHYFPPSLSLSLVPLPALISASETNIDGNSAEEFEAGREEEGILAGAAVEITTHLLPPSLQNPASQLPRLYRACAVH